MTTLLTVHDLTKRFGNVTAADWLSFTVRPREIYGLLGSNGAWKTTTVKCILGLHDRDAGTISVFDHDP